MKLVPRTALWMFVIIWGISIMVLPSVAAQEVKLDVNDVSFLWPVPKTNEDVAKLLSVDSPLGGDRGTFVPKPLFEQLLTTAETIEVAGSAGPRKIKFGELRDQFRDHATWKIASMRIDPCAPGADPRIRAVLGQRPQIRIVVQPVTVNGDKVRVHDVTAHLVFSFVKPPDPANPRRAIPDKEKFSAITKDLQQLKKDFRNAGVSTAGKLSVHPALAANNPALREKVRLFLAKHLDETRLSSTAFMGLPMPAPEPWIFFAMFRNGDELRLAPNPSLGGKAAQMISFLDDPQVVPAPMTRNVVGGVSTAAFFDGDADDELDELAAPAPRNKDIPDVIAHPGLSHVFNTDCVSCHTESRIRLKHDLPRGRFAFSLPDGISGVDEDVLPKKPWNVWNFGWFPDFFDDNKTVPTATMRTANESAESADIINREFLEIND